MTLRHLRRAMPVLLLGLAIAASSRAWAQIGTVGGFPGGSTLGGFGSGFGYGANPLAGYGGGSGLGSNPLAGGGYRYGIGSGQLNPGFHAAGQFYRPNFQAARPQTTVSYQGLFDAITLVPGWSGQTRRCACVRPRSGGHPTDSNVRSRRPDPLAQHGSCRPGGCRAAPVGRKGRQRRDHRV